MGQTQSSTQQVLTNPITEVQVLEGHKERIRCLIDINSSLIASGADDGSLFIWNTASGFKIHSLEGHRLPITCLFHIKSTSGEEYLISGASDHTARVWDIKTGECIHVLSAHNSSVTCITSIHGKPNIICTGGNDG